MPKLWRLMPSNTNHKTNNSAAIQIIRNLTNCTAANAILCVCARKEFAADSAAVIRVAAELKDAGFKPTVIKEV